MKKFLAFCFLLASTLGSTAQSVPNGDFESWSSVGSYYLPDHWDCLNSLTNPYLIYTCAPGTPGTSGFQFLKLTSRTVTNMGVVPGIAVCGTMDQNSLQALSGFPYQLRPAALSGKWQYMAFGSDQGYIRVALTKWNSSLSLRDTVASLYQPLDGMEMSWIGFSLPLTYFNSETPDSCVIILSASNANGAVTANYSYLYVDELALTGNAGISSLGNSAEIILSPNPASSLLKISSSSENRFSSVAVYDENGKVVDTYEWNSMLNEKEIHIEKLPKGNYVVRVKTSSGVIHKKFIKQ